MPFLHALLKPYMFESEHVQNWYRADCEKHTTRRMSSIYVRSTDGLGVECGELNDVIMTSGSGFITTTTTKNSIQNKSIIYHHPKGHLASRRVNGQVLGHRKTPICARAWFGVWYCTCNISSLRILWKLSWLSCRGVWGTSTRSLVTTSRLDTSETHTYSILASAKHTHTH